MNKKFIRWTNILEGYQKYKFLFIEEKPLIFYPVGDIDDEPEFIQEIMLTLNESNLKSIEHAIQIVSSKLASIKRNEEEKEIRTADQIDESSDLNSDLSSESRNNSKEKGETNSIFKNLFGLTYMQKLLVFQNLMLVAYVSVHLCRLTTCVSQSVFYTYVSQAICASQLR